MSYLSILDVCVCVHAKSLQSCLTLWIVAPQASPSMVFSRQEYWSGLLFAPPWDLPDPGIQPKPFTSPALAGGSLPLALPGKLIYVEC